MRVARFFLSLLLVSHLSVLIARAAALPGECPEILPVEEVEIGMQAQGWTVAHGDIPEPFRVEILGVLRDGIALGRDMIIVEIADEPGSTMIERARGIWAGMSGSPVYVGDRLLGAVAWGFGVGPSRVGGVTPAQDMLDVLSLNDPSSIATPEVSVSVPASLRPLLAERAGLPESEVATLESLPLPFAVSGLTAHGREFLQDRLQRAGISAIVTPTSSSTRQQGELSARPVPGGNFAGLLALGDVSLGGVGTTTYVCGDRALAFGHPLRLIGATRLSANDAEAITIVTDPTTRPFKLANLGSTFGLLDQDRTVAIAATLGSRPPLIRIRSIVEAPDLGRSRTGVSWTPSSQLLPDVAAIHLLANLQAVFDEEGDGRSRIRWRIKGTRANGDEWFLRRTNRYASRFDISFGSIGDLFNQLVAIEKNTFENVTFRRVKLRAKVWSDYQAYHIESFTITRDGEPVTSADGADVRPGDELVVSVVMSSDEGTSLTTDLLLQVPAGALGETTVSVFGGSAGSIDSADPGACLFNHSQCDGAGGDSFQDLLDELANAPRNNFLHATLEPFDSADGDDDAVASRRFSRVVEGFLQMSINVVSPTATSTSTIVPGEG